MVNLRANLLLFVKGFCMGTADVIPGVSGGTIAFITGIYDQLVDAIRSVDLGVARDLLRLDVRGALSRIHFAFLIPLMAGILTAVVSTAKLVHHLLGTHPVSVWAFFFGLILASVWAVGRCVDWKGATMAAYVAGTLFSLAVVSLVPVTTPEALWFVFLCGAVAICAMILPGISGAFLLLILGKYEYITGAVRDPFGEGHFVVLVVFATGCACGLMGFSRLLHFLLETYRMVTTAVLTGFMTGALWKVWPWKEVLESVVVRGKEHVLREANRLPGDGDGAALALGLMVLGAVLVVALERLAGSPHCEQ